MIAKFRDDPLTVPKSTVLGIAEEMSGALVNKIKPSGESDTKLPIKPPRKGKKRGFIPQTTARKVRSFIA
jgi:hypothetical protein